MSVTGLGRVLLRRWYLTLVGLILTVALGAMAATLVHVKYEAKSYVLLLPPVATSASSGGSNPYLALSGLQSTVDVLARAMLDASTARALKQEGVTATYNVARDLTTAGPVLVITTDDKTSDGALKGNADVVARLAPTMLALQQQQGVKNADLVTLQKINIAKETSTIRKTQLRAVLVAIAVGLFGTVLFCGLIDGLIVRRRNRRNGDGPPDQGGPESAPSGPSRNSSFLTEPEVTRELVPVMASPLSPPPGKARDGEPRRRTGPRRFPQRGYS